MGYRKARRVPGGQPKLTTRPGDPVFTVAFGDGHSVDVQSTWRMLGKNPAGPHRHILTHAQAAEAAVEDHPYFSGIGATVDVVKCDAKRSTARVCVEVRRNPSYHGEVIE